MTASPLITELRELILHSAPEPDRAIAIRTCDEMAPLDQLMPFSSIIILGVIVAIEDRYGIAVTKADLRAVLTSGVTLARLARLIESRLSSSGPLSPVRGGEG